MKLYLRNLKQMHINTDERSESKHRPSVTRILSINELVCYMYPSRLKGQYTSSLLFCALQSSLLVLHQHKWIFHSPDDINNHYWSFRSQLPVPFQTFLLQFISYSRRMQLTRWPTQFRWRWFKFFNVKGKLAAIHI